MTLEGRPMRLRHGVDLALEEAADAILMPELKKITRPGDRDVLTRYMLANRLSREVYVAEGTPDAAKRRGDFNRVYNPAAPHLNSRDGVASPGGRTVTAWDEYDGVARRSEA